MAINLEYYDGKNLMEEGAVRISASSIAMYITNTRQFWGQLMLGEQGFLSSTASVLGTITHGFAESYVVTGDVDGTQMEDYIDAQCSINSEVDADIIRFQYPIMGPNLINSYVIPNPPTFVEEFLMEKLIPARGEHGAIYVGGSCDNMTIPGVAYDANMSSLDYEYQGTPGIITDYKTTSTKETSLPDRIPFGYKLQALVYAYLYGKRGIHVDRIRIVYVTRDDTGRVSPKTGKPLKQYPSTVKVLTETIVEEDYEMIEGIISVIADSIRVWQEQPKMRRLLAQDNRVQ